ncbi:MAG: GNAT family N-acetyltransferase [Saprospiraceae bacterium]
MMIRQLEARDNRSLAELIRVVMTEFECAGPGFSINDPEMEDLYAGYSQPRSGYYLLVDDKDYIMGGAGFAPLAGGDRDTCELRKMYFDPEARGQGWGQVILELIEAQAARQDYKKVYLETVARMSGAGRLYQAAGYRKLDGPMGDTGHHGSCELFYLKEI